MVSTRLHRGQGRVNHGITDYLLGAQYNETGLGFHGGAAYVVSGADLVNADVADGTADGAISVANIVTQPGSYRITGEHSSSGFGGQVSAIGDIDADGLDDFMIASSNSWGSQTGTIAASQGEAYIISAQDLLSAASSGTVNINTVMAQGNSYSIQGENTGDRLAIGMEFAGNVDGDGVTDFLFSSDRVDENGTDSGATYLLSGAELAAADAADGTTDGMIELDRISDQANSYQITGESGGDNLGRTLEGIGDVDGDGINDFFVGADQGGDDNEAGATYLVSGGQPDPHCECRRHGRRYGGGLRL